MIDRYSFLNLEELTEQRRHIKKKSLQNHERKNGMWWRWGGGSVEGVRDRKASRGEEGVGEH